jgi:uncharacterized protein (UPF0332 family)
MGAAVFCNPLMDKDFETLTHSGVRQMFGLHFIKPGVIDQDFGRFYTRLFDLRQSGDYEDFRCVLW